MKLIELMEVFDENSNLTVVNENDDFLSCYDGKNSIDEKYNECEVIKVYPLTMDTLVAMIRL